MKLGTEKLLVDWRRHFRILGVRKAMVFSLTKKSALFYFAKRSTSAYIARCAISSEQLGQLVNEPR